MSEELEKNQLGLWEKLGRLYGETSGGPSQDEPEEPELEVTENLPSPPPTEQLSPDEPDTVDDPASPAFPGPMFRLASNLPESGGRPAPPQALNALGRVHETCTRCRRSCKQSGRKLNRMLCIGFLPIED
ncbi:hypothetical protein LLH00_19455 [bacterium]|nr:hypothetical protein [bacterium]